MSETTDTSRVCVKGGYLVGPLRLIPADPAYFQTEGAQYVVGCNRFQCQLCGKITRQQPGLRDADGASAHAAEIYLEQDLAKSPYLIADANSRVYACCCSIVVLTGGQTSPFPNDNWKCAGHPPVAGGAGTVLPQISKDAANGFTVKVFNSNLQKTLKVLALTLTDGVGLLAMPAHASLSGEWPTMKIWTNETTDTPVELDFATVAGACVQLTDGSLWAY